MEPLDTLISEWRAISFDPTQVTSDPAAYAASFERGTIESRIDEYLALQPRAEVEAAVAHLEAALGAEARWARYRDRLDAMLVGDDARIRLVDRIVLDHHRWTEAHNDGLVRCAPWLQVLSLYEMKPIGIDRVLRDVPFPALRELVLDSLYMDYAEIRAAIAPWRRKVEKVRIREG